MKIIYGLGKFKPASKKNILTVGIFDGVHIGHQCLIKKAIAKAGSISGQTICLTFWPHPHSTVNILTLNQRLKFIAKLGMDYCILVKFTKQFSSIKPEDFLEIIIKKIRPLYIFVGEDFRFGRSAKGDVKLLIDYAKKYHFTLAIVKQTKRNGRIISSTSIRNLIQKGNLNLAKKLLGRPVSIEGRVIKGCSIASVLGYPTANIRYHNQIIPPKGVYAAKILLNRKRYSGLCYIGNRPTFTKPKIQPLLNIEAHMFNFNKNIYRKILEIEFIKRIRKELKFKDKEDLIKRIKIDKLKAKNIFKTIPA